MKTPSISRSEVVRLKGLTESGFAVLTAALLLGSSASPPVALAMGGLSVWMALRGLRMVEQAVPLDGAQRRELDRLASQSRHVRELLAVIAQAGQQPIRYDLERCRRLARFESLLDGRA